MTREKEKDLGDRGKREGESILFIQGGKRKLKIITDLTPQFSRTFTHILNSNGSQLRKCLHTLLSRADLKHMLKVKRMLKDKM